jgi:hypothetical protein
LITLGLCVTVFGGVRSSAVRSAQACEKVAQPRLRLQIFSTEERRIESLCGVCFPVRNILKPLGECWLISERSWWASTQEPQTNKRIGQDQVIFDTLSEALETRPTSPHVVKMAHAGKRRSVEEESRFV